jgi:hypothetical protein
MIQQLNIGLGLIYHRDDDIRIIPLTILEAVVWSIGLALPAVCTTLLFGLATWLSTIVLMVSFVVFVAIMLIEILSLALVYFTQTELFAMILLLAIIALSFRLGGLLL